MKRYNTPRYNTPPKACSGVRGVHWHAQKQRWMGRVGHDIFVGCFDTVEEAAAAVEAKRRQRQEWEDKGWCVRRPRKDNSAIPTGSKTYDKLKLPLDGSEKR